MWSVTDVGCAGECVHEVIDHLYVVVTVSRLVQCPAQDLVRKLLVPGKPLLPDPAGAPLRTAHGQRILLHHHTGNVRSIATNTTLLWFVVDTGQGNNAFDTYVLATGNRNCETGAEERNAGSWRTYTR